MLMKSPQKRKKTSKKIRSNKILIKYKWNKPKYTKIVISYSV